MSNKIATRRAPRHLLLIAMMLAVSTGCTLWRPEAEGPPREEASPASIAEGRQSTEVPTGGGGAVPGAVGSSNIPRTTGVEVEESNRLLDSRLQHRQQTIDGRMGTIDRQLDAIEMRRRQRMNLDPSRRNRAAPREVLLQREQRQLQYERQAIQHEQDRLTFERRVERAPLDPFADSPRFPLRSLD